MAPRLIDRSRVETFQRCPRERFLSYEWNGTGLERTGLSLPLINGVEYHRCFEGILKGRPIGECLEDMSSTYAEAVRERGIYGVDDTQIDFLIAEQARLLEGMVLGWVQTRMPLFLDRFEIHAIEQEFPFELAPDLIQMMRLDIIARRKSDGMLFIPDFKGTGTAADYWRKGFEHNNQVNSYILAVQETLKERVGGMIIEGMIKGQRKEDTALSSPFHGKQVQYSPFCYGYKNMGSGEVQAEYTSRKGFSKIATWEHYSTSEWLEIMGDDCVRDQFLVLEVQAPEARELKRWRMQVIHQEERVADGIRALGYGEGDPEYQEAMLDKFFPQTRTACFRYNSKCPFEALCYDSIVESDPIGSAFYQKRTAHHSQELESQNA